jgi:transcriptional regulator NrdR family protein
MVKLPDPQRCRFCGKRGRIIDTRMADGYRWRRRKCSTCKHRWNAYETLIDPRKITTRAKSIPI